MQLCQRRQPYNGKLFAIFACAKRWSLYCTLAWNTSANGIPYTLVMCEKLWVELIKMVSGGGVAGVVGNFLVDKSSGRIASCGKSHAHRTTRAANLYKLYRHTERWAGFGSKSSSRQRKMISCGARRLFCKLLQTLLSTNCTRTQTILTHGEIAWVLLERKCVSRNQIKKLWNPP